VHANIATRVISQSGPNRLPVRAASCKGLHEPAVGYSRFHLWSAGIVKHLALKAADGRVECAAQAWHSAAWARGDAGIRQTISPTAP